MMLRTATPTAPADRRKAPARPNQRPGMLDLASAPSAMEKLADSWKAKS